MKLEPGIYDGLSTRDYFSDPCVAPSLTQSIAKILIDRSPLHAWTAHPRLNPDYQADDDTKYDVGNIAHTLLIGRGKEIEVIDFDDWRTKAAKKAREIAGQLGKLAVLGKTYAKADRLVRAAREQLELRQEPLLFKTGMGEAVLIWNEKDIWFRQMVDWITHDHLTFCDFKTTDESAAPHALARKMVNDGWHIQAAMAERGLAMLHPEGVGRRRYLFVVQETQPPYALNIVELAEGPMTMGRKMLDVAARKWRHCMTANHWPGYPLQKIVPDFPDWAESQWLDREQTEFASNVLTAG